MEHFFLPIFLYMIGYRICGYCDREIFVFNLVCYKVLSCWSIRSSMVRGEDGGSLYWPAGRKILLTGLGEYDTISTYSTSISIFITSLFPPNNHKLLKNTKRKNWFELIYNHNTKKLIIC